MNINEAEFEKLIVDWLRHNGYDEGKAHGYNKDFALVDAWT